MTAGKNVLDSENNQDKAGVTEEQRGVSTIMTLEDRQALRKMMATSAKIKFGSVALKKSRNDLLIEIIYEGPREATKEDPVRLYFDVEVDPPKE
ncbi:unnamed protein product [Strongylus vulgaris]|uniref:Uncharacterized protein n=1 Tax=Strongylus vulgaris TaxID=40348 RepID=A0A3P7IW70_STRVU|nr:unnamed protein product [Strongylus vulgaris]